MEARVIEGLIEQHEEAALPPWAVPRYRHLPVRPITTKDLQIIESLERRREQIALARSRKARAPTISGQLYVAGAKAGGGPIKVGYSYRPSERVKALGSDLVLLHQTDRSYRNARAVELCAHHLLRCAGKETDQNEWFTATLEEAREAIEGAEREAYQPSPFLGRDLDVIRWVQARSHPAGWSAHANDKGRVIPKWARGHE